jgi:hypothetical protein
VFGGVNWSDETILWGDYTSKWDSLFPGLKKEMFDSLEIHNALIKVNADSILLKVSTTNYTGNAIVSKINLSPSSIKVSSPHIEFSGTAIFKALNGTGDSTFISGNKVKTGIIESSNWSTTAGSYYDLDNGIIKLGGSSAPSFQVTAAGSMTSTKGLVGNINIGTDKLYIGTGTYANANTALYIGTSGLSLTNKFYVSSTGALTTSDITANGGTIGGFTLGGNYFNSNNFWLISGATAMMKLGTGDNVFKASSSGISLGDSVFADAPFHVTMAGHLTATDVTISGTVTADSGSFGGWAAGTDKLMSNGAGFARIELDKANNRISIVNTANDVRVAMGYLGGLPKNDGSGNWAVTNYGFWAKSGDYLAIDGDAQYLDGDWMVKGDASYLIKNSSDKTVAKFGTHGGVRGVYFYDGVAEADANLIAKYTTTGITLGQVASGKSNILITADSLSFRNNTTASITLSSAGTGYFRGNITSTATITGGKVQTSDATNTALNSILLDGTNNSLEFRAAGRSNATDTKVKIASNLYSGYGGILINSGVMHFTGTTTSALSLFNNQLQLYQVDNSLAASIITDLTTGDATGIYAISGSSDGDAIGVYTNATTSGASDVSVGLSGIGTGVYYNYGVQGRATSTATGKNYGVQGLASGAPYNNGIYGNATSASGNVAYGIHGYASGAGTNWAGYFEGDTYVSANLYVGGTTSGYAVPTLNGAIVWSGAQTFSKAVKHTGTLSISRTMDLNPCDISTYNRVRLTTTSSAYAVTLTEMTDGQQLFISNVAGSYAVTICGISLAAGKSMIAWYDGTASAWRTFTN